MSYPSTTMIGINRSEALILQDMNNHLLFESGRLSEIDQMKWDGSTVSQEHPVQGKL